MTERQRRQRRRIRRFAPTVVFCMGVAVSALLICTLTAPPAQPPKAETTQASTTITQTPSTATKPIPLHTETAERVTEKPETITPETPETAEETPPEEISRYAELDISEQDIEILAALVYHEARGECFDGQVAVIEVVLNRCLSPEFPDTVEDVVFQRYGETWQFSPAPYLRTAEPTTTQYDAVYTAIEGTDYILPAEAVFFSTTAYNDNIVAVIGNHTFCSIEEVT